MDKHMRKIIALIGFILLQETICLNVEHIQNRNETDSKLLTFDLE